LNTRSKLINEETISGVNSHLVLITSSGKSSTDRDIDFKRAGIKLYPAGLNEEEIK
jgi:hypothetical protein